MATNADQKQPSNKTAFEKNCLWQLGTAISGEEISPAYRLFLLHINYTSGTIHSNAPVQLLHPNQYVFYQFQRAQMFPICQRNAIRMD